MTRDRPWHHPVNAPTPVVGRIPFADYDPSWPEAYLDERRRISDALGEQALRIEHIGSTAVPGLAAKPIIDILLVVTDVADEEAFVPFLELKGYVVRIREPADDPDSPFHAAEPHLVFKGSERDLNLHVWSAGSPEITKLIQMRDWLRSHPDDCRRYEQAKRRLIERTWDNVQQYADAKDDILAEIRARIRSDNPTH